MSLISFIEKLRQKPRYVRVQILWVSVIICMTLIFGLWLWTLKNEMNSVAQSSAAQNSLQGFTQLKQDLPTLWQSLGSGVGSVINSIKDQVSSQSSPTPSVSAEPGSATSGEPEMLPINN